MMPQSQRRFYTHGPLRRATQATPTTPSNARRFGMRLIFFVAASLLVQKTAAENDSVAASHGVSPPAKTKSFTDRLLNYLPGYSYWKQRRRSGGKLNCRNDPEGFNEDCQDCLGLNGITVEVTSRPSLPTAVTRAESTKVTPSDRIKRLIESREQQATTCRPSVIDRIEPGYEHLAEKLSQLRAELSQLQAEAAADRGAVSQDDFPIITIPAGLQFLDDELPSFVFTGWVGAKDNKTKQSPIDGITFMYDEKKREWSDNIIDKNKAKFFMDENAEIFYNKYGQTVATQLSATQAPLSVPLGSPSRTKGNPYRVGEENYHWHLYLGDGSDGRTTVVVKIKQDDTPPHRIPAQVVIDFTQNIGLKLDGNSFVFTEWRQVDDTKPKESTMKGRKFAYDEASHRWCDAEGEFYMDEGATHFYNASGKTVAVKRSATIVKESKKLEPGSPAQEDYWLLHRGDNADPSKTDVVTIAPDSQDGRRRLGVSPVLAALTEEIGQARRD